MESKSIGRLVQIRLHSSIEHPGQSKETLTVEVPGRLIKKENSFYLLYEEEQNGEKIKTTVKMNEFDALIMRSGAVTMRLPFHTKYERPGEYGSGSASFKLFVKTTQLEFTEATEDVDGRFNVVYELHAEGRLFGKYEITIIYTEGI